jgi:hypothetical protein
LKLIEYVGEWALMDESSTEEKPVGDKWAMGIMIGFVASVMIVTFMVITDACRRGDLEIVKEPTAVGEMANSKMETLGYNGVSYRPIDANPIKYPEYNAIKVGMANDGKTWIYHEKEQPSILLVKVGSDLFIKIGSN